MACGATGWLAGRMLEAAVSRQREFLADARAVQFTASSDGLRGMLRKAMAERASRNGPQGLAASRSLHHRFSTCCSSNRWPKRECS